MVSQRACKYPKESRQPCQAPPMLDSDFCFWHDPAHAAEAAQARKLGGQRRRRESALAGAYDLGELTRIEELQRLLQIAAYDTLSLENSVQRNRALASYVPIGSGLIEKGELADKVRAIEAVLNPRDQTQATKGRKNWWWNR
jgi:hypothetical protein